MKITMKHIKVGLFVDFKESVLEEFYRLPPKGPFLIVEKYDKFFVAINSTWNTNQIEKIYTEKEYPEYYI